MQEQVATSNVAFSDPPSGTDSWSDCVVFSVLSGTITRLECAVVIHKRREDRHFMLIGHCEASQVPASLQSIASTQYDALHSTLMLITPGERPCRRPSPMCSKQALQHPSLACRTTPSRLRWGRNVDQCRVRYRRARLLHPRPQMPAVHAVHHPASPRPCRRAFPPSITLPAQSLHQTPIPCRPRV